MWQDIESKKNSSYITWMDTNVSDLERFAMVMTLVDYGSIGEKIMGNILNVTADDKYLVYSMYQFTAEVPLGIYLLHFCYNY